MKKIFFIAAAIAALFACGQAADRQVAAEQAPVEGLTLSNENITVVIAEDGSLASLKNNRTGMEYAGGDYLWRLYYDAPHQKELQIVGEGQNAKVSLEDGKIVIRYDNLNTPEGVIDYDMELAVSLEDEHVRFASSLTNNEAHTVIREFQYPLVRDMNIAADHELITSQRGGQRFENPKEMIIDAGISYKPYRTPAQFFRQFTCKYPSDVAMNCFVFAGENEGIYFGSHDPLFQDTWHGLRVYRDENREFTILEGGFYKYPHCFPGETWTCDANVVAPYSGTWHKAADMYRAWADTWYDHRESPQWLKDMTSWQRVIFKHQYGEYLFKYPDLYGRIKDVGHSVGCNAVIAFGWWEEGMDNGNPDYSPDRIQGGDEGWSAAIREFKKDGDRLLMYYNGKLIDRKSKFWTEGEGRNVSFHNNTGAETTEQYRFTNLGTWLGEYDANTFVVANTSNPIWQQKLLDMATRAYNCGADAVFYDQLGYGEIQNSHWDLSREYPVPNIRLIYDKGQALKLIREHIKKLDPTEQFTVGTERLTDYTAQYCDYIHMYPETAGPDFYQNFFRYTFPEIILTDRGLRDDTDVERRVNQTVLIGTRNDIEIYRCRDLIDDTPIYQAYLAEVNKIKVKYADELLRGRFNDCLGFELSNKEVTGTSFLSENRMAVVLTNALKEATTLKTKVNVPGYEFVEAEVTGNAKVAANGKSVTLGQHDLAVLLFKKK